MNRTTKSVVVIVSVAIVAVAAFYLLRGADADAPMSGIVIRAGEAAVTSHDQFGASDSLVVDTVTAPGPAWLVAYRAGMEGMAGAMLGYVAVPAGTSRNVTIPIDPSIRLTTLAIIVLNADRGVPGRFEFDMDRFEASTDKPYYVAGAAVQTTVTVALPENTDTFDVPMIPAP